LVLKEGAKEGFGEMTRFGMLTAGPGGQMIRLYLDDVAFTSEGE